jgi:hypothetical protein
MDEVTWRSSGPLRIGRLLAQIWWDSFPSHKPVPRTVIERGLLTVAIAPTLVSPVWLGNTVFKTERSWSNWADAYVISWLLALLGGLNGFLPAGSFPRIAATIAGWRIIDIVSYQLNTVLIESQREGCRLASLERAFLFAIVNFIELVTAFAVIYMTVGVICTNATSPEPILSASSLWYYSLVTMATLGYGEFIPGDANSRLIVDLQIMAQVVFALAVIPIVVGGFTNRVTRAT